jgi:hypothetical protein
MNLRHTLRPLNTEAKAAVAVLFLWMLALTVGLTIALIVISHEANKRSDEQRATAGQAYAACIRSKVFGPPFIDHIERVEAKLHTGALEQKVPFEGKQVGVLDYYRSTIPKTCATP